MYIAIYLYFGDILLSYLYCHKFMGQISGKRLFEPLL